MFNKHKTKDSGNLKPSIANPGDYNIYGASVSYVSGHNTVVTANDQIAIREARRQNRRFLRHKLREGQVTGLLGLSAKEAEQVWENGGYESEDKKHKVFVWDTEAAQEAVRDAKRRARAAGESGSGVILELKVENAKPEPLGRLGYVALMDNVELANFFPAEQEHSAGSSGSIDGIGHAAAS